MKRLIENSLAVIAIGIIAGCSPQAESRKVLKAENIPVFTINVSGILDNDIPYHHQPGGSENVYILTPETGRLFILSVRDKAMKPVCRMKLYKSEEAVLQGFTVDEKANVVRIHYGDSTVNFTRNGKRLSVLCYDNISRSGYIYPTDRDYLPIFRNGKLYCAYFPSMEDGGRNPAFTKEPVEAVVDLKSRKVNLLQQTYPANYLTNYYPLGTTPRRMEISKNVHAYTFPQNDSVFIRNIQTGELEVKFFGTRRRKVFRYIPYGEVNKVNASVFDEIAFSNPGYELQYHLPLAGYFFRYYVFPSKPAKYGFDQSRIVFDTDFDYVGEIPDVDEIPGFPIDSKKGVFTAICEGGKLTVRKLSW